MKIDGTSPWEKPPKRNLPRWNWIVTILAGIAAAAVELVSAFYVIAGSFGMLSASYDLERVFGMFGLMFGIPALLIEAQILAVCTIVIGVIAYLIDRPIRYIGRRLRHEDKQR